jgi:hypothetical protein
MKSFYSFQGSWFDILDKLIGIIKPSNVQRFTIWESKKNEKHLLIVYGTQLSHDWQERYDVKGVTEPEFQIKFKPKMKEHIIHGYNEFNKTSRLSFSL